MPRAKLIRSDYFPYHVLNRSNNKEWFYLPLEQVWKRFISVLGEACVLYKTQLHAFTLMANHYHMILSTPNANLDLFMRYFQTETCKQIQRKAGRINHVFGTRYKSSLLWNPLAFGYAYKYVLRNPVRAGAVSEVSEYKYSSLFEPMGKNSVPIVDRTDVFSKWVPKDWDERMKWLNQPSPKECEAMVGRALRRFKFQFPDGNETRKQIAGLVNTYGIGDAPATFPAGKEMGTFAGGVLIANSLSNFADYRLEERCIFR